jgi:hypothetical protein
MVPEWDVFRRVPMHMKPTSLPSNPEESTTTPSEIVAVKMSDLVFNNIIEEH